MSRRLKVNQRILIKYFTIYYKNNAILLSNHHSLRSEYVPTFYKLKFYKLKIANYKNEVAKLRYRKQKYKKVIFNKCTCNLL